MFVHLTFSVCIILMRNRKSQDHHHQKTDFIRHRPPYGLRKRMKIPVKHSGTVPFHTPSSMQQISSSPTRVCPGSQLNVRHEPKLESFPWTRPFFRREGFMFGQSEWWETEPRRSRGSSYLKEMIVHFDVQHPDAKSKVVRSHHQKPDFIGHRPPYGLRKRMKFY